MDGGVLSELYVLFSERVLTVMYSSQKVESTQSGILAEDIII